MKPSMLLKSVVEMVKVQQPLMIWGPPGVGKSAVVHQAAEAINHQLIDIRAILLDPVDLRGVPFVDRETRITHWAIPCFLPKEDSKEPGILFVDELPAAAKDVQAAFFQLVLDRQLGEYHLPDSWVIVAAGNRTTDRSVSHTMPSALANRFVHVECETDMKDWQKWAVTHGNINHEVMSFLKFKPQLLHNFDPEQKAFPTPRSWEFASRILPSLQQNKELEYELLQGAVGEGAASEFISFIDVYRKLPDPKKCIADPKKAKLPKDDEPSILYALTGAVAHYTTDKNFANVVILADRIPPEFQVVLMQDVMNRMPELAEHDAYTDWALKNSKVVL